MFHLIKNKGKFDLKFKVGSNLIFQTPNQGYERKAGVYKVLRSIIRNFEKTNGLTGTHLYFQDDTNEKSLVYKISMKTIETTGKRPKKKYSI